MPKSIQARTTRGSVGEHLSHLMNIGLRLIPLDRGAKQTHEHDWAAAGERHLKHFIDRAARHWQQQPAQLAQAMSDTSLYEWTVGLPEYGFNVGVLHKASGTVCLDLDHVDAIAALQAGVQAVGGPAGYLPTSTLAWTSVRGRKWLWKAPKALAGRSVRLNARRRLPTGAVLVDVVLELRGSGQDMIPPGYRTDAQRVLAWDAEPSTLQEMPAPIADLMTALMDGDEHVIGAMQAACNVPPELRGIDPTHVDDYPARLAAATHERLLVNANVDVAELLTQHGYRQAGKRWGPPDSTHADGITMPADNRQHWHCWHESNPLSGQFDAWRAFVELECGGDLTVAKREARSRFKPRIGLVKDRSAANPGGQTRTIRTGVAHDEKLVQRTSIPPDEKPVRAAKRASSGLSTGQGTTPPATPPRDSQRDLPAKGPKRARKAGRSVPASPIPPEVRQGAEGAFSCVGGLPDGPLVAGDRGAAEPVAVAIGNGAPIVEGAIEGEEPIVAANGWRGRLSARSLLTRQKVAPRMMLRGHLQVPVGAYILAGASKAGKSWLALGQSLVLSGWLDEVMGMRAVEPADGIYILTDDSTENRVHERFDLLRSDGHGIEDPPTDWEAFTTWPPEGSPYEGMSRIDALDAFLEDNPKCRHVTIDTLVSWREADRDNAVVQQEYTEVRNLQEVARKHGVLLFIVHYVNKGGSAKNFDWDDPFTSIAGTTALQGGADGMMLLHRVASHDGNQHGALWFRCRDIEEQEAAGELAKPCGRWTWLAASADAIKTLDVRRAVIEWLFQQPALEYHPAKTVLDGIAGVLDTMPKIDSFRRTLGRMKHEGLVETKSGSHEGGYRLSAKHRADLIAKRRY